MTLVFDTEPLVAFAFDERGADVVEDRLSRVHRRQDDGYTTTLNAAEFWYVASRKSTVSAAERHLESLMQTGLQLFDIDQLWSQVAMIKFEYNPALGDAYALAAAQRLENESNETTLLVGGDDCYDEIERSDQYGHLIERFRDGSS